MVVLAILLRKKGGPPGTKGCPSWLPATAEDAGAGVAAGVGAVAGAGATADDGDGVVAAAGLGAAGDGGLFVLAHATVRNAATKSPRVSTQDGRLQCARADNFMTTSS